MELVGFIVFIILLLMLVKWMADKPDDSDNFKKTASDASPFYSNKVPQQTLEKVSDDIAGAFAKGTYGKQFNTNLLLKKGEHLVFDVPDVSLCEERSVGLKGGYQGFSVRIMKGVSYRFGGFRGGAERRVTEIDRGNLTLTNKRMVFSGAKMSKDISLSKLNTIQSLEDGVSITRSGKQKAEYYVGTDVLEINTTVKPEEGDTFEAEDVKWRMSGAALKSIIQKLLQE